MSTPKAIIWDFDGVFYNYADIPDMGTHLVHAHVNTALAVIPSLTDRNHATALSQKFWKEMRSVFHGFADMAVKDGLQPYEARERIQYGFHRLVCEKILHNFRPDATVSSLFNNLSGKVTHAIASHSCVETMIEPILEKLDLKKFFNRGHILGVEHFNYQEKHGSPFGIQVALARLGTKPEETIFVEDTVKNLQVAKVAFPALETVLLSNNPEPPEQVDRVFPSQKDFLQHLTARV